MCPRPVHLEGEELALLVQLVTGPVRSTAASASALAEPRVRSASTTASSMRGDRSATPASA